MRKSVVVSRLLKATQCPGRKGWEFDISTFENEVSTLSLIFRKVYPLMPHHVQTRGKDVLTLPSVFVTAAVIVFGGSAPSAMDIPIHVRFHVVVTVQPCLLCRSATHIFTTVPKRIMEEGNKLDFFFVALRPNEGS